MATRMEALRRILGEGTLSTQDELRDKLEKMDFAVTQSTVSRDLRKLGAIRAVDPNGQTVYRLPEETSAPLPSDALANSLRDLVIHIKTNGSIIAIRTTPGSASLVARHLDYTLPDKILGTLAGDDTIFVAPTSIKSIRQAMVAIQKTLGF
jgi:transcriptional regulator of arginine metabolism